MCIGFVLRTVTTPMGYPSSRIHPGASARVHPPECIRTNCGYEKTG